MAADTGTGSIPAGLDETAPGPALAALVAGVDIASLSGHDRVVMVRTLQRIVSYFTAQMYRAISAVADAFVAEEGYAAMDAAEATAAEVGAALNLTRRSSDHEVATALDLCRRLPAVWMALASGDIDVRRARTILQGTHHLPMGPARAVVDEVMPDAGRLTTGQLAAQLRKTCIEVDPHDATQRYETAVEERRVVVEPTPWGTSTLLGIDLPPHRVAAGMRRLNRLARSLRRRGESRTMDQLRADVLLDLLIGVEPVTTGVGASAHRGMVDIHVDLTTLAELDESSGDLAGYGPVIADIARQAAEFQHDAEWRFAVTDPESGDVQFAGVTRRRPTSAQRRWVDAAYWSCVWPGCRMPARDGDLDHRRRYSEGGVTAVGNLAPLCRFHHRIRHRHGWRYRRLVNGDHVWTSPLRHAHITSRPP
jgi:hypothetical protein